MITDDAQSSAGTDGRHSNSVAAAPRRAARHGPGPRQRSGHAKRLDPHGVARCGHGGARGLVQAEDRGNRRPDAAVARQGGRGLRARCAHARRRARAGGREQSRGDDEHHGPRRQGRRRRGRQSRVRSCCGRSARRHEQGRAFARGPYLFAVANRAGRGDRPGDSHRRHGAGASHGTLAPAAAGGRVVVGGAAARAVRVSGTEALPRYRHIGARDHRRAGPAVVGAEEGTTRGPGAGAAGDSGIARLRRAVPVSGRVTVLSRGRAGLRTRHAGPTAYCDAARQRQYGRRRRAGLVGRRH